MDQRTSEIEEDLKDILRTRMALADKLQLLEQRVEEKVQGTKMAALDVITHAKNTALDFVETTSQQFNPTVQAGRRPWLLVGGAVAIGFLAGWLDQRRRRSGVYPYYPEKAQAAEVMSEEGGEERPRGVYPFYPSQRDLPAQDVKQDAKRASGRRHHMLDQPQLLRQIASLWEDLTGQLVDERERIMAAALHTGRSFIQDLAHLLVQSLVDGLARRPHTPARGLDRSHSRAA